MNLIIKFLIIPLLRFLKRCREKTIYRELGPKYCIEHNSQRLLE